MSSESYHEAAELLSEDTKNLHRALVSLREELEAVDWYQQREDACSDEELSAILRHNRDEEVEHAMMTLEWLRRNDANFAAHIATYLNADGPITEIEERKKAAEVGGADAGGRARASATYGSLGIGSLRGVK